MKLRAACVQMCSGRSQAANIEILTDAVAASAAEGAQYILTPEMTGILEKNSNGLLSAIKLQDDDPVFAAASQLARQHKVWLHIGSTAIRLPETDKTGKAANRAGLFAPDGRLVTTYDKIHMFDVRVDEDNTWRESNRYEAGSSAPVVTLAANDSEAEPDVRLGLSICYDIRFPDLYRKQALAGADILTCPAAFTRPTGEAHWEVLLRARAIENGAFMLAAAQSGEHEDGRKTYGHSMMIDPWGRILGELGVETQDILVCDLDLSQVGKARSRIPALANTRDFTISTR